MEVAGSDKCASLQWLITDVKKDFVGHAHDTTSNCFSLLFHNFFLTRFKFWQICGDATLTVTSISIMTLGINGFQPNCTQHNNKNKTLSIMTNDTQNKRFSSKLHSA
jgi:hypothetical protein